MIYTITLPTIAQLALFRAATECDKTLAETELRDCAYQIYTQKYISYDAKKIDFAIAWDTLALNPISVPAVMVDGALICGLSFFLHHYPEVAQRTFFSKKDMHWQYDDLSTLVHAAYNRAVVVYVPADIHVTKILDLQQLLGQYVGSLLLEQVYIIVDKGSMLTIYDKLHDLTNVVVRCVTGWISNNARITVVHTHQAAKNTVMSSINRFYVDNHASLELFFLMAGSGVSKAALDLHARGKRAEIKVNGGYLLHGDGVGELTSYQYHNAAHTLSAVTVKNVVQESAQTLYRGTIRVDHTASCSDATQKNQNLLLSSHARAYSLPEIEVLTHDVHCTHGSSAGRLDEEQLFYLQTRGIDNLNAQQILIEGFLGDIFAGLEKQLYTMMQACILDELVTCDKQQGMR